MREHILKLRGPTEPAPAADEEAKENNPVPPQQLQSLTSAVVAVAAPASVIADYVEWDVPVETDVGTGRCDDEVDLPTRLDSASYPSLTGFDELTNSGVNRWQHMDADDSTLENFPSTCHQNGMRFTTTFDDSFLDVHDPHGFLDVCNIEHSYQPAMASSPPPPPGMLRRGVLRLSHFVTLHSFLLFFFFRLERERLCACNGSGDSGADSPS